MATEEPVASSPAPTLVQQALREVLWGDLAAAELPEYLRKDVEGVRGLEGQFMVIGVKVEFRKAGGGKLGVEEYRRCHKLFESTANPKFGDVLTVTRNTGLKKWELRFSSNSKVIRVKLGRSIKRGCVVEGKVEQGGLVIKDNLGKVEVGMRGDGDGGLLFLVNVNPERYAQCHQVYMTRRI